MRSLNDGGDGDNDDDDDNMYVLMMTTTTMLLLLMVMMMIMMICLSLKITICILLRRPSSVVTGLDHWDLFVPCGKAVNCGFRGWRHTHVTLCSWIYTHTVPYECHFNEGLGRISFLQISNINIDNAGCAGSWVFPTYAISMIRNDTK